MGVYKESRDDGLNVSLMVCNGTETFVFKSVPCCVVLQAWTITPTATEHEAGEVVEVVDYVPNRCEVPEKPNQLPRASYANVARSPLQSHTVQRAKQPSAVVEHAVAAHASAEFAGVLLMLTPPQNPPAPPPTPPYGESHASNTSSAFRCSFAARPALLASIRGSIAPPPLPTE